MIDVIDLLNVGAEFTREDERGIGIMNMVSHTLIMPFSITPVSSNTTTFRCSKTSIDSFQKCL